MREKYIEQQLAKEVRSRGGLCEKWNSGTSGWPDRIVILPDGKVGFVEVKAPGKEPRKLQTHSSRNTKGLPGMVKLLFSHFPEGKNQQYDSDSG